MSRNAPAEKSVLDLCDEAVHLIRGAPAGTIATYYVGSIPFILGLLFFWADMTSSALGREDAAPAALGLAILYVWMLTTQAVFAQRLRGQLAGRAGSPGSLRDWLGVAGAQAAWQPAKLFVLPVALLLTLPFPFVFALYHSASVTGSFAAARRQAALWPRQNLLFLGVLSLLSVVVFANLGIVVLVLPYLFKMLFGVETVFTRSVYTVFNSTFLAIIAGLSYLVLNPFAKAFYVLRCFYGESITTAEDLRAELKAEKAGWQAKAPAQLVMLMICLAGTAAAQPPDLSRDLDHSIDRVLKRPEYAWRLPRVVRPDHEQHNWLVRSTLVFLDATSRGFKRAADWIDHFVEWLGDRFTKPLPAISAQPNARPPTLQLRLAIVLLLALTAGLATYLLWRLLTSRTTQVSAIAAPPVAHIEPVVQELDAGQQAPEQWLELARACLDRQDFRLALRALHLAGLAGLASATLVALQRGKSDRDYARELSRRAPHRPELIAAFARNLSIFERGWYGMYDVDLATIQQFEANLEQMRPRAEQ